MKNYFLRLYDWLTRHKSLTVLVLLAVLGLCVASALRLDYQEDISSFLPKAEAEQLQQTEGQEKMAVFFQGGTLDERLDAMYTFAEYWNETCPDIPVSAEADQGELLSMFEFLSDNWPYFLEPDDYRRMDTLLNRPAYYAEQMARVKESLYGLNPLQERYYRTDPLGLFSPVLERLQRIRPENRMEDGCLFTPDGETGIVLFSSPYGGSESGRNADLVRLLDEVKARTAADCPSLRIFSTGGPEVAVENAGRIKKDSILALLIAGGLICLLLWLSYKRIADVLWILLSIAAGALFALGLIACFKSSVSLIVLGIGCTIIGIAVNYPLHYVDHLKYQPDKRKALAEQVNPLLVGNITTVGAFLGMLLLKADALHDFGFIGAMMLVGTILFVLVFLPVFVPLARKPRTAIRLDWDRHIRVGNPSVRRGFFLVFVALTLLMTFWSTRVGFDADLHHINYMTAEQEKGFAVLEGMRPAGENLSGYDRASQEKALALWKDFRAAHPEVPERLAEAAAADGFAPDAFRPFLDGWTRDWAPQERAYFAPIDLTPDTGLGALLVKSLSEDFDTIGFLCSFIVFFFLWLSFGSIELSLTSFLPLAVSWVWILGTMHLFGIEFNIINIILATFIFGQGDDYTIFITEGLMYEYATGKKILRSYKNAVVLSALVMFIGIGALIVAKHPAMRSLAEVTVVGMITVVVMAYYLPPLVFRFLTRKRGGALRRTPLTLRNLLSTAYISLMFALALGFMSLWAIVYFAIGKDSDGKRLRYHRLIRRIASWAIRTIPGGKYTVANPYGEDFSKPAVYVCNHQSHFDVLAILALQPKIIFMTNDWTWKFYGPVIRKAEFYPASYGLEKNSAHMKRLLERGYSIVIFPEGTRSEDCHIQRFHRGAFQAARELGLPVLPLYIHGFGYALPKHDFLLRKAGLYLEIGQRVTVPEGDLAAFTRAMRHHYVETYARIRRERETAAYNAPLVRSRYLYKGHDAMTECRRVLRRKVYAEIDALCGPSLDIPEAGSGVYALLAALTHPDMAVTAHISDEEQYLTAIRCEGLPDNLTYVYEG